VPDGRERIDRLRDDDGGLSRRAIEEILPYGDDFLFVDRVSRLTEREVEASFQVPTDSAYLRAHFRGLSVMPGALIAEGLSQAATLVVRYNLAAAEATDILVYEIKNARWQLPAVPGDSLSFTARVTAMDSRAARIEGRASIDQREVCRLEVLLGIVPRRVLAAKLEASAATGERAG